MMGGGGGAGSIHLLGIYLVSELFWMLLLILLHFKDLGYKVSS